MPETMRAGRTIWDYWAPRYDRLYVQRVSLGPSRALVHAHIDEVSPAARRFLDLGCGIGQFARELAERHAEAEVVGLDPTHGMIERARRDFAHPRVRYLEGSIEAAPADGGFDVVTCMHAFPYIPDPAAAAARFKSLLRPGGRVIIIQANAHSGFDRFILWFVERTTTPARYRSTAELAAILATGGLRPGVVRPLPRRMFVPSIHLVEGLA